MKNLMLSLSLLAATPYAFAQAPKAEAISQDAYLAKFYQNISDICKTHENPRSLLVAIPLVLIVVNGDLPQSLRDRIHAATQSFEKNEPASFNNDAMDLIAEIIPYMQLVDSRIATSIKEIQKLGVRIVAISPFMPEYADAMLVRMKELGLDFKDTALYTKDMPIEDEDGNCIALSKNGVVFMNDYFQSVEVLETIANNAPKGINQLIIAAPTRDSTND